MALFVDSFQAQSLSDLETTVNAALAALTNPTIRLFTLDTWVDQRRIGTDLRGLLTYEDGGASLGTPFVLKTFFGTILVDLEADIQTFIDANPTYFITGVRLLFVDVGHREPQYIAWLLYNTDSSASANYLPQ